MVILTFLDLNTLLSALILFFLLIIISKIFFNVTLLCQISIGLALIIEKLHF